MCTWPAASRSLKTGAALQLTDHQNRRLKKRCSYGVRTVELERSKSGYGFTISGQYPCILSCIVYQSPAEKAGLRTGDYLIAVNNKNVSKSLHDDVVKLIGNSSGVLKLQIADNYYTDSSDDDLVTVVRPKLKYPNRLKNRLSQNRAERVVEDLHAGVLFKQPETTSYKQHDYKNITDAQLLMHQINGNKNELNCKENMRIEDEVNSLLYPSLRQMQSNCDKCDEDAFYRAVVGYLGTIEMPKDLQIPRLQAIRNCIRRLRIEKKVHILVVLSVFPDKVTLINSRGMKVAEYPSEKITYSGIYANDKKFFGLVTSNERRKRSSCHVFIVESKLKLEGSRSFSVKCGLNSCCEFPETAEPILCAISSLYRNRNKNGGSFGLIDVTLTNRSNTSSNSSNSDSGIGFKDDFHHQKDSVFVVHDNGPVQLNRVNMKSPATVSLNQNENRENRLTVRAMPNPIGLSNSSGRHSCNLERNSFHKYAPNKSDNSKCNFRPSFIRPVIAITPKRICSNLEEYKLSPKVYGVKYPNQLTGKDILAGTTNGNCCCDDDDETDVEGCTLRDGSEEVNPSEGRRNSSDSDDEEVYSELDNKWIGISSLKKCKQVSPHSSEVDVVSNSEEFLSGKSSPSQSIMGLDVNNTKSINTQGSRVASWAVSFDKLLEDPAGVHTFAVFLKREFSYENIHFWVACERYKMFALSQEIMEVKSKEIFQRHLCAGATEPVNVDSQARQIAEESLDKPNKDIFIPAQKQIYNLMKFDCYSRFLKSSVYKDSLVKQMSDEPLLYTGDDDLDPSLPYIDNIKIKGQKDKLLFEERRRKSLLSWNRKKNETVDTRKSARKNGKEKKDDAMSDTNGSRSSLANGDLIITQRCTNSKESLNSVEAIFSEDTYSLCRMLLPDESTAVVQTKPYESVLSIIRNVLDRRNLTFTAVEVFLADLDKIIDLYEDSRVLSNTEIRVEERVIFRLTLPNKKTLIIKNNCDQIIRDALRSILNRYGFKMKTVVIMTYNNEEADLNLPARNFDMQGLLIDLEEKQMEWGSNALVRRKSDDTDPILKLFDDIINEKVQPNWDEFGVLDTDKIIKNKDKNTLEPKSTGIMGIVRRNSLNFDRDVKKMKNKNRASIHESLNHRIVQLPVTDKPPIHKVPKKQTEKDDLYHVWERAQRSRLDDQRGTEINFEMPDFLKPQLKKIPLESRISEPLINTKYFDETKMDTVVVDGFSGNSIIPSIDQAEEFFSAKSAGYINFCSKDELPPQHCTRKTLSLTSKPSQQFSLNKVSMGKSERTHSFPNHESFNLPLSSSCNKRENDLNAMLIKSHDDSITPSKIPLPLNGNDTSLHVEEANFTPPARLQLPTPPDTPPPLPPKPKYYPPRPRFGVKKVANTSTSLSNKKGVNKTINDLDKQSRRAMYIERNEGEKFSISFV